MEREFISYVEREFISYEHALAMKKLGFNEVCFGYYNNLGNYLAELKTNSNCNKPGMYDEYCTVPLYQQTFRFFREKYNLFAPIIDNGLGSYDFRINYNSTWSGRIWNTYEEAELACLNKLIEIAKTDNPNFKM